MSKKGKPTQAIMIEVSGNTVWAHVANAYGQHLKCVAGYAKCHPNDTFDFYEGARIALARAFGKNPFPKTDDAEKPSGEKAEEKTDVIYHPKPMEPSFQVGDIVRTGDLPFAPDCLNQTAKVIRRRCYHESISYDLSVIRADGTSALQCCSEYRDRPAPLTLLWREEK